MIRIGFLGVPYYNHGVLGSHIIITGFWGFWWYGLWVGFRVGGGEGFGLLLRVWLI